MIRLPLAFCVASIALLAADPGQVSAWKQTAVSDKKDFASRFNLGVHYYGTKEFAQAAAWLDRAVALSPSDFNARYLLGGTFAQLGKVDEALRHWRVAQKQRPDHSRLLQLMAVEYRKGRYFNEAADTARLALARNPADPNLHLLAIKALQDAGDTAGAAEVAAAAVQRFPDSARAHFEHGFHLQKQGSVDKAIASLRKAIELDPAYEEPPFFMGDLLVKLNRPEEAIPYLRTAIRNRNDYVPARVLLARALMKLERWKDAISELDATVALDPDHPQPRLLLSQIYFRLGDEDRARKEREVSLTLRRKNPEVLEAVQGRPFPDRNHE